MDLFDINNYQRYLIIYPHPDDEVFSCAGLIQKLVKNKINFMVLILTKGGATTLKYGVNKNKDIKVVRQNEFYNVCKFLNIKNRLILDLEDKNLENTSELVKSRIKEVIFNFRPDIVVTYEPDGIYGHPDHIYTTKVIYDLNIDEKSFKILYSTVPENFKSSDQSLKMAKKPAAINPVRPNLYIQLTKIEYFKKIICFLIYKSQFNIGFLLKGNKDFNVDFTKEYFFMNGY